MKENELIILKKSSPIGRALVRIGEYRGTTGEGDELRELHVLATAHVDKTLFNVEAPMKSVNTHSEDKLALKCAKCHTVLFDKRRLPGIKGVGLAVICDECRNDQVEFQEGSEAE